MNPSRAPRSPAFPPGKISLTCSLAEGEGTVEGTRIEPGIGKAEAWAQEPEAGLKRQEAMEMKVEANGINVHYVMEGPDDAPVITLSHSLATDLSMWNACLLYTSPSPRD